MKKTMSLLLVAALLGGITFGLTGCVPREQVLKIATWEAYTDEDYVKKEFPNYYQLPDGKKITVKISSFAGNEELYTKLTKKKVDYDVICPSDYMVQRLIQEDRLEKLDKTIITNYGNAEDFVLDMTKVYDKNHEYTVPYAWGTFGILYNTKIGDKPIAGLDANDMTSWNALWNKKPDGTAYPSEKDKDGYYKKIWIKDSERDAFAMANLYGNAAKLKELSQDFDHYENNLDYQALLNKQFEACDDATLNKAKENLIEQRKVFYKYEEEEGKVSLAEGNDEAYLGLFWSCDAGYAMQINRNLRYEIPKEGSNVYVDCFVIPTTAKNKTAAQQFMKFLLEKDTAYKNTMASGSSGVVKEANQKIFDELDDMIDNNSGFMKDTSADFQKDYIYKVVFPDKYNDRFSAEGGSANILARCAPMTSYIIDGVNRNGEVTKMFVSAQSAKI